MKQKFTKYTPFLGVRQNKRATPYVILGFFFLLGKNKKKGEEEKWAHEIFLMEYFAAHDPGFARLSF